MEIKYLGGDCFRIREKGSYLLLGQPSGKVEADLVVTSADVEKFRNRISAKSRDKPFFIIGPGEYEIGGIEVWGGRDGYWQIKIGYWHFCFMNNSWKIPDDKKVESLGQIDILFLILPNKKRKVGKAKEAIKRLSPLIVIPGTAGEGDWTLGCLNSFLDEMDQEDLEPKEKLVLKHNELPDETRLVLLKSKHG